MPKPSFGYEDAVAGGGGARDYPNSCMELDEYIHVGQDVSADPSHEKEIRHGISMGSGALVKQHSHVTNSGSPLSSKTVVYNQWAIPDLGSH